MKMKKHGDGNDDDDDVDLVDLEDGWWLIILNKFVIQVFLNCVHIYLHVELLTISCFVLETLDLDMY